VLEHPGTWPTERMPTMDEVRIPPAGDPFTNAPRCDPRPGEAEWCHCCYDGWVWLGHVVPTPDGDEEIVHEPVPCRRCTKK
jgi:hypothetical protein